MKNIAIFSLAIIVGMAYAAPSAFAQATAEAYMNSGGTGKATNSSGYTTGLQAVAVPGMQNYSSPNTPNPSVNTSPTQTPLTQGGLPYATQNTMAPSSVDMTPYASGRFNYGFNTNPTLYPYMGVNGQPSGSMLPVVSTGSVDFNTCDLPWCYPDGVVNQPQGQINLIDAVSNGQQLQQQQGGQGNTPVGQQNNNTTPNLNPVNYLNSNQSLQAIQQYFGL